MRLFTSPPNLFRILGSVDALNEHMGLNLTWHDVVWMYEFHLLRYYLKSRSSVVRLISCLLKSNKGIKDDPKSKPKVDDPKSKTIDPKEDPPRAKA